MVLGYLALKSIANLIIPILLGRLSDCNNSVPESNVGDFVLPRNNNACHRLAKSLMHARHRDEFALYTIREFDHIYHVHWRVPHLEQATEYYFWPSSVTVYAFQKTYQGPRRLTPTCCGVRLSVLIQERTGARRDEDGSAIPKSLRQG